jgi:cytoskeletal protein RodZ
MQKDPQKIILSIAIVLMLVPASLLALIAINLFQQFTTKQNPHQASTYQTAPTESSLTEGTIDIHPTFLPPDSTVINTNSSQPPTNGTPTFAISTITPTTIPTAQPSSTPTPIPTPTPANGSFTIQIVSYPQETNNNTVVSIQVHTDQPNAILQLDATYNLAPYVYQISDQVTDFVGNATIYWSINLYGPINPHSTASATARFYITGTAPDNLVATSSIQSIQVLL